MTETIPGEGPPRDHGALLLWATLLGGPALVIMLLPLDWGVIIGLCLGVWAACKLWNRKPPATAPAPADPTATTATG